MGHVDIAGVRRAATKTDDGDTAGRRYRGWFRARFAAMSCWQCGASGGGRVVCWGCV